MIAFYLPPQPKRTSPLITLLDDIRDVVQHLFEIQSAVHGYLGPETQQELVRKMYAEILLDLRRVLGWILFFSFGFMDHDVVRSALPRPSH